jgi:signal peptidase II
LKKYLEEYASLLLIAGIVVAIDQGTKALVRANLALEEFWAPWEWLEPYARIVHWKNRGAAFGMLPGFGDIFMVLAIIVALAILYYFPQVPKEDWPLRLAMGLQFGGALGNLIDRLTIGWVTDFISIGSFPVFNVADASISTGVVVLVLGVWIKERQQGSTGNPPDSDSMVESVSEPVQEETWGE